MGAGFGDRRLVRLRNQRRGGRCTPPQATDNAPWVNYFLLPIAIVADVATSPIQLWAVLSYGDRIAHPNDRPIDGVISTNGVSK